MLPFRAQGFEGFMVLWRLQATRSSDSGVGPLSLDYYKTLMEAGAANKLHNNVSESFQRTMLRPQNPKCGGTLRADRRAAGGDCRARGRTVVATVALLITGVEGLPEPYVLPGDFL